MPTCSGMDRAGVWRFPPRRTLGCALLACFLLFLTSAIVPRNCEVRAAPPAPPRVVDAMDMIRFYSYDEAAPLSARLVLKDQNSWYRRYELTYLSEGDTVYAAYFEPKTGSKLSRTPAVVGVHGMFSEAEDQFWFVADFAAKRGFAVLMPSLPYHHRRAKGIQIISGQKFVVASPETVRGNFRRAVIDMRRALDWLLSREDVDPTRVYITGASLGGIVAALAYKVEPRFAGGVFLVSGGDFANILAHSDTPVVRDFRLISSLGITDLSRVAEVLTMADPAALPDLWPRPVLMLNATQDVIFPVSDVRHVAASLHNPQIIWAKSSHYYPVAGAQYLMTGFWAALAGLPLTIEVLDGSTCYESIASPMPGDTRLWVSLALDARTRNPRHGASSAGRDRPAALSDNSHTRSAEFGIHLVNRLTPALVLCRATWDAHKSILEQVPASVLVMDGDTAGDLDFALSYIKLLGRSAGGAYVVCTGAADRQGKPNRAGFVGSASDHCAGATGMVAHLDPLSLEVVWSASSMMAASGLASVDMACVPGLSFEQIGDLGGYFSQRIKTSKLPPIPALPDDRMVDIRWAEPPF